MPELDFPAQQEQHWHRTAAWCSSRMPGADPPGTARAGFQISFPWHSRSSSGTEQSRISDQFSLAQQEQHQHRAGCQGQIPLAEQEQQEESWHKPWHRAAQARVLQTDACATVGAGFQAQSRISSTKQDSKHRAGFQSQFFLAQQEQDFKHRAGFQINSPCTAQSTNRMPGTVFPGRAGAAPAQSRTSVPVSYGTEQSRMPDQFCLAQQEQHWHRAEQDFKHRAGFWISSPGTEQSRILDHKAGFQAQSRISDQLSLAQQEQQEQQWHSTEQDFTEQSRISDQFSLAQHRAGFQSTDFCLAQQEQHWHRAGFQSSFV
ncbi:uncharacterized protein LOC130250281 isoform X2 [Oenanthe melanoleuca]|uniref:uncharacterized protein LOC130250281 isoform X2 n=1 Tax=Oenanthe melanoleuca TaxID=2939378 RepID=UPI0024C1D3B7|nr:uncharacterized protein LOC130250281 isoform X2 [Oenanthe melanoleuca]